MNVFTIDDFELKGKRVLVRVDFNVPIKDGKIEDDTRIKGALPTIKDIIEKGGRLILMSHLGNPKGEDPAFSLQPVAEYLSDLLDQYVIFSTHSEIKDAVELMKDGDVILMENLRFNPGEKKCDPEFSKFLASLCDIYLNDAFGTAHRKHASVYGIVEFVENAGVGRLMQKEIEYLSKLNNPEKPYTAVLGGAKISTKIEILKNLIRKVDRVIVGGGMAFTFLKAQGIDIGDSIVEEDKIDVAYEIMRLADKQDVEFLLPVDFVCATELKEGVETKVLQKDELKSPYKGLDIGPLSISIFSSAIKKSKTIVWNGPMGVFEVPPFDRGTKGIIEAMEEAKNNGTIIIAGGGDTVSAIKHFDSVNAVSHISTGGGSFLEFMAWNTLPAIEVLESFYKKKRG